MKKQLSLFIVTLVCLTAYALYASQRALHRGELTASVVMLIIAVMFWKRIQKSS